MRTLDFVQNAHSTQPGEAQFGAKGLADGFRQMNPSPEDRAGTIDLKRHEASERFLGLPGHNEIFAAVVATYIFSRKVQSAARYIDAEVLPEVRQLERRADRIRFPVEATVAVSEQPQDDPSDWIRRPATIIQHISKGLIASDRYILAKCREKVRQQFLREVMFPDGAAQCDERGMVCITAIRPLYSNTPSLQFFQSLVLFKARFVGDVIGDPRKRVHGCDVGPYLSREYPRSDRKILVMRRGQLQTPLKGRVDVPRAVRGREKSRVHPQEFGEFGTF